VPATLLVLFSGLLWLIGLCCGKERRAYIMKITSQATGTVRSVLSDPGQQTQDKAPPNRLRPNRLGPGKQALVRPPSRRTRLSRRNPAPPA
jgi:hypothetical protein